MKLHKAGLYSFAAAVVLASAATTSGGTYKHITIDGSLADWAGVPPAFTRAAPDTTLPVAYKDVYVANDENYLYLRFTLFTAADPFTSANNIFIDADNDVTTGFAAGGSRVGSEMLIQSGAGYQEKNKGFNEGGINGLDWAAGPAAPATDFEMRISRHATYASDSLPVFTLDTITFALEEDGSPQEWVPDTGGLSYTFEAPPGPLTTALTLVDLTATVWRANDAGTDLGTAWLDPYYDDSQAGWTLGMGLFGYTPNAAAYPTIYAPLASGRNTYYLRTHFTWNNSTTNLAFVVTNYLSDGAVYYLNGGEVRRVRMPAGPVGYSTSATATNTPLGAIDTFGLDSGPLIIGDNILEVELHQAPGSTADMVFGLSLTANPHYAVRIVDPTQPADRTVVAGESTTFAAEYLGSGPLSFQWLKGGAEIAGATEATYTIPVVLAGDAGDYSLRISNDLATNTTRTAVLTVTHTPVVLTDPSQPADQTVVEGNPVTLAVLASGSAPLQYQWFKGATAIPNATNATYDIAFALPADTGSYHAVVNNAAYSTNSRTATLTVLLDTAPPQVVSVEGSPNRVLITFSEPVDVTTAEAKENYTLDGGASVVSAATPNRANATEVLLTTTGQVRGTVYTLTINNVKDLFGNPVTAGTKKAFLSTIVIDGSFDDWQGLTPLASKDPGSPTATDFKNVYVFNDANYIYFRLTFWAPSEFVVGYNNIFIDTDNNPVTGFSFCGSELLVEAGIGYDERDGGYANSGAEGLQWLASPEGVATNIEFRIARTATFSKDQALVFTNSVINFALDGEDTTWTTVNRLPPTGGSSVPYTIVEPPAVPPGPLYIASATGQVTVTWYGAGTLQSRASLTTGSWTDVPSAKSPYSLPATGGPQYFRLAR